MSKRHWIMSAGAGMALLLTSCATSRTTTQPVPSPTPQAFAQPIVPAKSLTLPPVKITGMIPPTDSKTRLLSVENGSNRDPFAATVMPANLRVAIQPAPAKPIAPKPSQPATPAAVPSPPARLNSTPMPPVAVSPLPTLQPAPPPLSLPAAPSAISPGSRTNLAAAIALTGVIQTGSTLSAIVQDTDGTPRYVQTGDSLAGGQVTLKRINVNSAGLPSIVLQQNGVEFIRTVGSAEGSVAQAL